MMMDVRRNHGWNKRKVKMCNEFANRAMAFRWLHDYAAKKRETLNVWLGIISAFGAFLTGAGGLFTTLLEYGMGYRIAFNALVVAFATVGIVKRRLGLGEIIGKHRTMVGKYELLSSTINKETMKGEENRDDFAKFYSRIRDDEISIRDDVGSAAIDHKTYEVYKKYFGDDAIKYSRLFGNIPYTLSESVTLQSNDSRQSISAESTKTDQAI